MKSIQDCWIEIKNSELRNNSGIMLLDSRIPFNIYAVVEGSSEGIALTIKPKIPKIEYFESYGMKLESCELFNTNGVKLLHNSLHREEFLIFLSDLLSPSHYESSSDPVFCLSIFLDILNRWKKFFKIIDDKSYFDLKGFFGEMIFLKKLLDTNLSQIEVLEAWQIDNKSRVDFIFNRFNTEMEIKTIETGLEKNICISSIDQLSDVGRKQFLVVNKLISGGEMSIGDLYRVINEKLNESLRIKFNNLLTEFKIPPKILDRYNAEKFSISETSIYSVDNLFPRITRSNVHAGIVSAKYEVALLSIPISNYSTFESIMGNLK